MDGSEFKEMSSEERDWAIFDKINSVCKEVANNKRDIIWLKRILIIVVTAMLGGAGAVAGVAL